MTHELLLADDPDHAAALGARFVADAALAAVAARGACHLVLAGGSTPTRLYQRLALTTGDAALPWDRVHVWFGDERVVPPDHDDSNYRMAREALLAHVPVPAAHVHRMEGERPPDDAARDYEAVLRRLVPAGADGIPQLDLVLLGLGADGHTASLFPGSAALDETMRLVAVPWVEVAGGRRLTMTHPMLNAARDVLFVVTGHGKADVVRRVLEPEPDAPALPAARVRPRERLIWLVDRAAASRLARVS